MLVTLLRTLLIRNYSVIATSDLIPFGSAAGDSQLEPGDDQFFGPFDLEVPVVVFGTPETRFFVSN